MIEFEQPRDGVFKCPVCGAEHECFDIVPDAPCCQECNRNMIAKLREGADRDKEGEEWKNQ